MELRKSLWGFELPSSGKICLSQLQKCCRKSWFVGFIYLYLFYCFSMIFLKLWSMSYFKMNVYTGEKSNSESQSFETLKYGIADNTPDVLLDNSCNPDVKFFNVNFHNFGTPYLLPEKFYDFLNNTSPDYFFILHLNIRSIKKTSKLSNYF